MSNQYINKVIYGGQTLIDLTSDTVDAAHLLYPYTAHLKNGSTVEGSCTYDSDTTDADAAQGLILNGKIAYVNKVKVTGSMPNNGAVNGTISAVASTYTVPQGYHDGSGKVTISTTEQAKIIASNIKSGVTILGVSGSYAGLAVSATTASATPTTASQTILPPSGYDYLSQVTINAIPYAETDNSAGGVTVTIG